MAAVDWWWPALACAGVALVTALPLRSALRRHSYRYDDEQHLPARTHRWVTPALPAAAFALAAHWWPSLPPLPAAVALAAYTVILLPLLAALTAIDLDVHRLPDRLTGPLSAMGAAAMALACAATGDWGALGRALLAGAGLAAAYLIVLWCSPGGTGLGFGDVKLAPGLGILTGWVSWSTTLTATMLAFITAGLWASYLLITRRARGRDRFAFGPFMILGALVAIFVTPLS